MTKRVHILTDEDDLSLEAERSLIRTRCRIREFEATMAFLALSDTDTRALSERAMTLSRNEPDPEQAIEDLLDTLIPQIYGPGLNAIAKTYVQHMRRLGALYKFFDDIDPDGPLH